MAKLNQDQLKAAKFYQTSKDNIAIQALAGTGKTSTILALTKLPKSQNCLFLAFTNATKDELIKREPSLGHRVKTTYQIGLKAVRRFVDKDIDVVGFKYHRIVRDLLGSDDFRSLVISRGLSLGLFFKKEVTEALVNKISLCLANLLFYPTDIKDFCKNNYEINPDVESWLYYEAIQIGLSQVLEGKVHFADMISFPFSPLVKDANPLFDRYPVVFVDEAQDLSLAQIEIVRRSNGGQLIAVGDENQSIFGFAGSTGDSLNEIIESFQCKVFEMPLCYRCPTQVLDEARKIVPQIQGLDRHGTVTEIDNTEDGFKTLLSINGPLMVTARTNMKLLEVGIFLLDRGVAFNFHRDNIESKLRMKIEEHKENNVPFGGLYNAISFEAMVQTSQSKLDILDCIMMLISYSRATKYSELFAYIREIFYRRSASILLGSVHSFKGNEEENVMIWGMELFPHPRSQTEQELQQDQNLLYVAITRAKQNLYKVDTRN